MKIRLDEYNCCTAHRAECPFTSSCAQHSSAGDFRSESGFTPKIKNGVCFTAIELIHADPSREIKNVNSFRFIDQLGSGYIPKSDQPIDTVTPKQHEDHSQDWCTLINDIMNLVNDHHVAMKQIEQRIGNHIKHNTPISQEEIGYIYATLSIANKTFIEETTFLTKDLKSNVQSPY